MPFLLATPMSEWVVPPICAEKTVGVLPKSPSDVCCEAGTCHEPTRLRFEAVTATTASARVSLDEQLPGLPVAKYRVLLAGSTLIEPHNPAPTHPVGTMLKVLSVVPPTASNWKTCPWTSGQSPHEAVPM